MISNTGYLITGENLNYLISFLNSKCVEFIFRRFYSTSLGNKGLRWLSQYIIDLPIPLIKDIDINSLSGEETELDTLFYNLSQLKKYKEIDRLIYTIYNLTSEEIEFIEHQ